MADPVPAVTFGVGCRSLLEACETRSLPQSGAQFSDVLEFANENNLTIPGGSDVTIGVGGGYLQVRSLLDLA